MNAKKNYQQTLPQKRMGSGALFLNEQRQILLVNPTYKPQWEIPGGIVEENESPRQACIREVEEELGLAIAPEHLLSIGYQAATDEQTEGIMFIFFGGVLDAEEIAQIKLPKEELSEYRFWELGSVMQALTPRLGQRVVESFGVNRNIACYGQKYAASHCHVEFMGAQRSWAVLARSG